MILSCGSTTGGRAAGLGVEPGDGSPWGLDGGELGEVGGHLGLLPRMC